MSPFDIIFNVVLPIFILIGIGMLLDRAFRLDVFTLAKLNFYIFTPAMVFLKILFSDLQAHEVATIALVALTHYLVMCLLSAGVFSLKPFAAQRTVLSFGSVVYNAGNYGFPLMLLAFGERAVSVIAIVLLVQVALLYTIGLLLYGAGYESLPQSLLRLFRMPVVYAIPIAFALRALHLGLPDQLAIPLGHLGDGFVSMALLTLGVQLSRSKVGGSLLPTAAVSVMRLAVSPLVATGLVLLFKPGDELGPVLIVGAGLPVAINVFIMATEFDRDADFASQMVFWTTLFSAGTIPVLLLLVR